MVGQVKSVKGILKQLQASILTLTAPDWPPEEDMARANPAEQFAWLSRQGTSRAISLFLIQTGRQELIKKDFMQLLLLI
jgi:hypothetical protein